MINAIMRDWEGIKQVVFRMVLCGGMLMIALGVLKILNKWKNNNK